MIIQFITLIDIYKSSSINVAQGFTIFPLKTPQLIGIVCGCIVFAVTIAVVIYLLYASGTIKGFLEEIRGQSSPNSPQAHSKPQLESLPRLHDHLLEARTTLPSIVSLPVLIGKKISLRTIDRMSEQDQQLLFEACNGSPQYDESAYDPCSLWTWIEKDPYLNDQSKPWDSFAAFTDYLRSFEGNICHIAIEEREVKKPIGMITIFDNNVRNLSLRIGNYNICRFSIILMFK